MTDGATLGTIAVGELHKLPQPKPEPEADTAVRHYVMGISGRRNG